MCVCEIHFHGGNWCWQGPKWLFPCLTEDNRRETKNTKKVARSQRRGRMVVEGERSWKKGQMRLTEVFNSQQSKCDMSCLRCFWKIAQCKIVNLSQNTEKVLFSSEDLEGVAECDCGRDVVEQVRRGSPAVCAVTKSCTCNTAVTGVEVRRIPRMLCVSSGQERNSPGFSALAVP